MPSRTDSSSLHVIQRWSALSWGSAVGLKVSARCSDAIRCFLLTAAQYCCCSWTSLTDQLVRKFKDSLGINTTMKKIFIFVPVQTVKKIFLFLPVQQYECKHHVRSIARSGVSPGGARSDGRRTLQKPCAQHIPRSWSACFHQQQRVDGGRTRQRRSRRDRTYAVEASAWDGKAACAPFGCVRAGSSLPWQAVLHGDVDRC